MKHLVALAASSLLVGFVTLAGCEGDDGGGSTSGGFDGGGFDSGSGPGSDGSTTDAEAGGGDGGSGEGGITPPPTTPNDVYVDPAAGVDTNTGKSGSPFKSLTKAFSVVPAGAGVHLLDGTYNAANESGSTVVTIPADVNVRSENPRMAKLTGLIVKTTGGATALYDLVFFDNTQLDAVGTTKLLGANLLFLPNADNIMNVNDSAEVTLAGGMVDGQGTGTPIGGSGLFRVLGTGSLTLDGTIMQNSRAPGIRLDGPAPTTKAKLVVKNNALFDNVGSAGAGCTSKATIIAGSNASVLVDHATIKNSLGTAVCVAESSDVTLQNGSSFLQNDVGVNAQDFITTDGSSATVRNCTFTNNTRGIAWLAAGKVDVSDTTFTAVTSPGVTKAGIQLFAASPGLTAIVRKTTIHGEGYGVHVAATGGTLSADLGTTADLGNNDFSGNTVSGLRDELPVGTVLDAQGNTWTPSIQNADAAGHFPAGTVVSGPQTIGTNFYIGAASTLNL